MTDDLARAKLEAALQVERSAVRPDPGTSASYPTLRKGVVTSVANGDVEVDDAPAANISGRPLAVNTVVWLLADQGRRLVIGSPEAGTGGGPETVRVDATALQTDGGAAHADWGVVRASSVRLPIVTMPAGVESTVGCSVVLPESWSSYDLSVMYAASTFGSGDIRWVHRARTWVVGSATLPSGDSTTVTGHTSGSAGLRQAFLRESQNRGGGLLTYANVIRTGGHSGDTLGIDIHIFGLLFTRHD